MGTRDRIGALKRARQRQQRIEQATRTTTTAQAAVDRAGAARTAALAKADAKIADAEHARAEAIAQLAEVAGSPQVAADILGISAREAQRACTAARRNGNPRSAV